jgi:hypothetical protein
VEHDESLWTAGGGVTRNIQPHVRGACYRWSMSEVCATEAASDLDAIAAEAWALEVPSERRRGLRCHEAAVRVDGLLTRFARGRGALDVAIGEGLVALGIGDRALQLGYSGIGDYAREQLGIAASTAHKMARLARGLRDRPLLREAVWTGEVTARQAETMLPVARGDDEASWVARARAGETVRELKAAVKAATGAEAEQDEEWERVSVPLSPEARPVVEKALELAGRILGTTAPKWQRIEAICKEYLGAHCQPDDAAGAGVLCGPVDDGLDLFMQYLEQQTAQWAFLERTAPVLAPVAGTLETDPLLLDAELRRIAGLRAQWDDGFGHLAMLMRSLGLWRDVGFASFGHYCSERLGMAGRTVEQRIALEHRLQVLPPLRQAMREGRISYEKARLVAWQADDATVEELIGVAEAMTCIDLRRKLEAQEETQMCARGDFDFRAPRGVGALLSAAFSAAREAAGGWIPPAECLRRIAQHFVDTWEPALEQPTTLQRKILARDRGFCQVPGCSREAKHVHHIKFRSAGGTDDPWNLVSLCIAHHLYGVHKGWIRVRGVAPDGLIWEIGPRVMSAAAWRSVAA